jgi:hypothetical protein
MERLGLGYVPYYPPLLSHQDRQNVQLWAEVRSQLHDRFAVGDNKWEGQYVDICFGRIVLRLCEKAE